MARLCGPHDALCRFITGATIRAGLHSWCGREYQVRRSWGNILELSLHSRRCQAALAAFALVAGFMFLAQPASAAELLPDVPSSAVTVDGDPGDGSSVEPGQEPSLPVDSTPPLTEIPVPGGGSSSTPVAESPAPAPGQPVVPPVTPSSPVPGSPIQQRPVQLQPALPPVVAPSVEGQPVVEQPVAEPQPDEAVAEDIATATAEAVVPSSTPKPRTSTSPKPSASASVATMSKLTAKPASNNSALAANIAATGSSLPTQSIAIAVLLLLGLFYFRVMRRGGKRSNSRAQKGGA